MDIRNLIKFYLGSVELVKLPYSDFVLNFYEINI